MKSNFIICKNNAAKKRINRKRAPSNNAATGIYEYRSRFQPIHSFYCQHLSGIEKCGPHSILDDTQQYFSSCLFSLAWESNKPTFVQDKYENETSSTAFCELRRFLVEAILMKHNFYVLIKQEDVFKDDSVVK